jgi:hypothetical protein
MPTSYIQGVGDTRLWAHEIRMIEARAIPGLKGETWGTHIFNLSDVGHPPTVDSLHWIELLIGILSFGE